MKTYHLRKPESLFTRKKKQFKYLQKDLFCSKKLKCYTIVYRNLKSTLQTDILPFTNPFKKQPHKIN